ncbi:unnamed protein product, partial [Discosporangium mesarthrocarpum]
SGAGGGVAGDLSAEVVLSSRPALELLGWLLDLETRCLFWSAVLDCPVAASDTESLPGSSNLPKRGAPKGNTRAKLLSGGALRRLLVAAGASTTPSDGGPGPPRGGRDFALGHNMGMGGHGEPQSRGVRVAPGHGARVRRLRATLQQLGVHRVQQIYAELNGVVLGGGKEGGGTSVGGDNSGKLRSALGSGGVCMRGGMSGSWRQRVMGGGLGWGGGEGEGGGGRWGDEVGFGEMWGWSMMMPYLPVWVDFAAKDQVVRFLEAFFARCGLDVLMGRVQSRPLQLLADASFLEIDAVAKN